MNESIVHLGDDWMYVRHSVIEDGRPFILFLHGLGESGLLFSEALLGAHLSAFNVLIPDWVGYGRSSASGTGDYSFSSYFRHIDTLLEHFGADQTFLVGHSMGGDIGTLLCGRDGGKRVKKFVNVEGNLTTFDLFISRQAIEAHDRGEFSRWYDTEFGPKIARRGTEEGPAFECYRRYYASLRFCRIEAFLANARELVDLNPPAEGAHLGQSEIGDMFANLPIPTLFFWGTASLHPRSQALLDSLDIPNVPFQDARHWPMIDRPEEFYRALRDFLEV